MIEFTHTITDREGLHARPASELTSASRAWESDVLVSRNGGAPVDAKTPSGSWGSAPAREIRCT